MEWFVPDDVDMEGVEFKALTSGSHNMTTDFVLVFGNVFLLLNVISCYY